jgi:uncharacterized protein YcfJ
MRKVITGSMLGMLLMTGVAAPAMADDRDRVGRSELRRDREDVREERREYREARRSGDRGDIREERRELREARRELRQDRRDWQASRRYNDARRDQRYGGYYGDQYARGGYDQPRRLSYDDRIYRGQNGQYYCRRSDGTTGAIVGVLGGGALGNIIAPGGSKTLGTIIGAIGGGVAGRAIDRGSASCR